jgi:hypothetical protein
MWNEKADQVCQQPDARWISGCDRQRQWRERPVALLMTTAVGACLIASAMGDGNYCSRQSN